MANSTPVVPPTGLPSYPPPNPRLFPAWKARYRVGQPMTQHHLVKYSPKWGYARLMNFPFRGSHFRPRMNTLVLSIDGGSRGNNKDDPNSRAAYGVFFGRGSEWNRYGCLTETEQQSSGRAEMQALLQAMILLEQRYPLGEMNIVREVIIKSDSEYVVKSFSEWIYNWEANNYQKASKKEVIEHVDLVKAVQQKIRQFEVYGMAVQFWLVGREFNVESDALCNRALDEWATNSDSGYGD